jgi:hypothetical protein
MSAVLETLIARLVAAEARLAALERHEQSPSGDGAGELLLLDSSGHAAPHANNVQDIGSTGSNWRSIYLGTDVYYNGDLKPGRNTTNYTAYAYVPIATPVDNASWNGDAHAATDSALLDTSSVFSLPPGIKAVVLAVEVKDETPQAAISFGPASDKLGALVLYTQAANYYASGSGIVPCDANGDIYVKLWEEFDYVYLRVVGYYI